MNQPPPDPAELSGPLGEAVAEARRAEPSEAMLARVLERARRIADPAGATGSASADPCATGSASAESRGALAEPVAPREIASPQPRMNIRAQENCG